MINYPWIDLSTEKAAWKQMWKIASILFIQLKKAQGSFEVDKVIAIMCFIKLFALPLEKTARFVVLDFCQ